MLPHYVAWCECAGLSLAWTSVGLVRESLKSSVAIAVPGIAALWLSLGAIALNEALFRYLHSTYM